LFIHEFWFNSSQWLRSFDQRLRESIDYAICLNSIGSWNNELWMHVSKPPENAYVKQVFDVSFIIERFAWRKKQKHSTFHFFKIAHLFLWWTIWLQSLSDVAKEMGITIGIKHKKINISNPRVSIFSLFLRCCHIWYF